MSSNKERNALLEKLNYIKDNHSESEIILEASVLIKLLKHRALNPVGITMTSDFCDYHYRLSKAA